AYGFQQLKRFIILYKEVSEGKKNSSVKAAIRFEEQLIFAKDSGDGKQGYLLSTQFGSIVMPEFIFDKDGKHRPDCVDNLARVGGSIHWEVEYEIRIIVTFLYFVPGR